MDKVCCHLKVDTHVIIAGVTGIYAHVGDPHSLVDIWLSSSFTMSCIQDMSESMHGKISQVLRTVSEKHNTPYLQILFSSAQECCRYFLMHYMHVIYFKVTGLYVEHFWHASWKILEALGMLPGPGIIGNSHSKALVYASSQRETLLEKSLVTHSKFKSDL